MQFRRLLMPACAGLVLCSALLSLPSAAQGQGTSVSLYDGSVGTTPDQQNMVYGTYNLDNPFTPSKATQTYDPTSGTILDTTGATADAAGYTSKSGVVPALDRAKGFALDFAVGVLSEKHNNNNRAGFSVILLGSDKLGIELGFWSNQVWAQEGGSDSTRFTHAEGAPYNAQQPTKYRLAIVGDTYQLVANGSPVLSGKVRDYTGFKPPFGAPNPYQTPNFIFLGDDTPSAQARIDFDSAVVTTEVVLATTPTATATTTATPTRTATATVTATPTRTATATTTAIPTKTATATTTPTKTATATVTTTPATATAIATATTTPATPVATTTPTTSVPATQTTVPTPASPAPSQSVFLPFVRR